MQGNNPFPLIHHLRREALVGMEGPAPVREARAFAHVLAELPVGVVDGETLLGDYGPLWGRPSPTPPPPPVSPRTTRQEFAENHACIVGYSPAHTCVDYEQILRHGLAGLRERIAGEAPTPYREAMAIAVDAVRDWAARFAALDDSPGAAACAHVPEHPARTFHEALQSIWLCHTAIGISELSAASLSLGRLDQYLYPWYAADRGCGVPETELERSYIDFCRKLNRYGDAACAVNLGGVGPDSEDQVNDLTRLIVRVAARLQQPSPLLAARIHDGLDPADFDRLTDPELLRIGQPTFYGEEACRAALRTRGVPADDVHRWAVNSCMGLMMPGEEVADMWGVVVNLLLPLELSLNNGHPFRGTLPIELPAPEAPDCFGALFEETCANMTALLHHLCAWHRDATDAHAAAYPNPWLSALLHDGIERGLDRAAGGPRWHTVNVDAFGLVNAADALTAIRHVVWEQRRWSLAEVVAAARDDFVGADDLRRALLAAPKYGNDDNEADSMVARLARRFADAVHAQSTGRYRYMPSFHTLNRHVGIGRQLPASLDGRRAGDPLAKNIGPGEGRAERGLTALIRSATAVDQSLFDGGQALDLSIDAGELEDLGQRRRFQALLRTYFALGGLEIQVNGLTADDLRAARSNPERHRDLIVRVAGYSARYVDLSPALQDEMITRFTAGL